VIAANGDGYIKQVLNIAKGLFSDLQKSPYRDRIFIILDATHSRGLPTQLIAMGIPTENIVIWPKNGIEYYYPPSLVDSIFGTGAELCISGDIISRNGIEYTKADLSERISALVESNTTLHPEFDTLFIQPLTRIVA
jgi:hypothetical protein